jgi:hypothetical protein
MRNFLNWTEVIFNQIDWYAKAEHYKLAAIAPHSSAITFISEVAWRTPSTH